MSANNRNQKDVQGTRMTRFKNIQSFNDFGVMTESSKDYNHERTWSKHGV